MTITIAQLIRTYLTQKLLDAGHYDPGKFDDVERLCNARRWTSALLHAHTIRGREIREQALRMIEERRQAASSTTQENDHGTG